MKQQRQSFLSEFINVTATTSCNISKNLRHLQIPDTLREGIVQSYLFGQRFPLCFGRVDHSPTTLLRAFRILASLSPEYFPREGIRSVLSTPQFPVTDTNQQKLFRLIEIPAGIIVHHFGAKNGNCKMAAIRHKLNAFVQRKSM